MILNYFFQFLAQTLDLISEDIQVAEMWIQALSHIVQATKSVELQKEHENYLRSQFQAADVTKDGYLLLDEFAGIVYYIKLTNILKQFCKIIIFCYRITEAIQY